jgi:DNA-directed RNA polymerase subunit RPC12/RpoP
MNVDDRRDPLPRERGNLVTFTCEYCGHKQTHWQPLHTRDLRCGECGKRHVLL